MRINKYLASCGVSSRRKAEELVTTNKVLVNGVFAKLATVVNEGDVVLLDGKQIKPSKFVYVLLNKPRGYVTTCQDEKGRKTVLDLVKVDERLFPVGRLDYDTSGLLILTNDGDFAKQITHPSAKVPKTYVAILDREITLDDLKKLERGIEIDGEKTHPARAKRLGKTKTELTITQGRNRQVRKMFEALGYRVVRLERTAVGKLTLGNLKVGEWRFFDYNKTWQK